MERKLVDRLTAERLMQEMNSDLFVSFLDASINHTRRKGYETRFDLLRSPSQDEFYYPDEVIVGDEKCVGDSSTERHQKLLRKFKRKYGAPPKHPKGEVGDNVSSYLNFFQQREEYVKKLAEFLAEVGEDFEIPMQVPAERDYDYSCHFQDTYDFMVAHTHPIGSRIFEISYVSPSVADLKVLRKDTKTSNEGLNVLGEKNEFRIPTISTPLALVISAAQTGKGNNRLSLTSCLNYNVSNEEVRRFSKELVTEEMVRTCFGKKLPRLVHSGHFVHTTGIYNPRTKEVDFGLDCLDALLETNE